MKKTVGLMLLALLLVWGCAETTSRRSNDMINWSSDCAMCGASVGGDYFLYSADRGFGPTNR